MSRFGERLELPLSSDTPIDIACPNTTDRYRLSGQTLTLI